MASFPTKDGLGALSPRDPRRGADGPRPRRHPRLSPRQVKLQRIEPYALHLPMQTQISSNFHHELLHFHQLLRDASISSRGGNLESLLPSSKVEEEQLSPLKSPRRQQKDSVWQLFTSDRGDAILKEFFRQWKGTLGNADESDLVWEVLDTLFRSLPLVISDSDASDGKRFFRYADTLHSLRDLLAMLLYKDVSMDDHPDDYALTVCKDDNDGSLKRIPYYIYCQRMEKASKALLDENEKLRSQKTVKIDEVNQRIVDTLLHFWDLPQSQYIEFFTKMSVDLDQESASKVSHALVERFPSSSMSNLLQNLDQTSSLYEPLQAAVAAELKEDDSGGEDFKVDEQKEENELPFLNITESGQRPSTLVGLHKITETFEDHRENSEEEVEAAPVKATKVHILERGREPAPHHFHSVNIQRGRSYSDFAVHPTMRPEVQVEEDPALVAVKNRDIAKEKLQKVLMEFVEHDATDKSLQVQNGITPATFEAAWDLIELLDGKQPRKKEIAAIHSVVHVAPVETSAPPPEPSYHDDEVSIPIHEDEGKTESREVLAAALGDNLTPEQQFAMKMDQLHSQLTNLNNYKIYEMSTEVVSAIYKRMPNLTRLFTNVMEKTYEAAGLSKNAARKKTYTMVVAAEEAESLRLSVNDNELVNGVKYLLVRMSEAVKSLVPLMELHGQHDPFALAKFANEMHATGSSQCHPSSKKQSRKEKEEEESKKFIKNLDSLTHNDQMEIIPDMILATCQEFALLKQKNPQRLAICDEGDDVYDNDEEDGDEDEEDKSDTRKNDLVAASCEEFWRKASHVSVRSPLANKVDVSESSPEQEEDDERIEKPVRRRRRKANRKDREELATLDDEGRASSGQRGGSNLMLQQFKQGAGSRQVKLFNVGLLLRLVDQLYREFYEGVLSTPQYGSKRMNFSEFVYDWHIRRYGLKTLAQQHAFKFIHSLRKYDQKVYQCDLCLRFLGIQNALGYHELKFVLGLLANWSSGSFSGESKYRVEHVPRQFKLRVAYAYSSVHDALTERFGVYFRTSEYLHNQLKDHALPDETEYVLEREVLQIALVHWAEHRRKVEHLLEAIYNAGDVNGDGSLEYSEFTTVMYQLSPSIDDKFITRIFNATYDRKDPPSISFDQFLDVILLEKVLNTTRSISNSLAEKRAISQGMTSDTFKSVNDEDDEMYQFRLLQETWENDSASVKLALSSITHKPTATSISFRISFLTQLLEKRVDSKTAWLCHRQIMREISKYQDLTETQIVTMQQKEESFKRAVMAVRSVQRLERLSMLVPSSLEPPMEERQSQFSQVVEDRLVRGRKQSTLADIAALEEELREQFIDKADESSIEDYKQALDKLQRMSKEREEKLVEEDVMDSITEDEDPIKQID